MFKDLRKGSFEREFVKKDGRGTIILGLRSVSVRMGTLGQGSELLGCEEWRDEKNLVNGFGFEVMVG